MIEEGLHVYIGTTGTGKTYKAVRDAIELAGSKRQGVLVIDSRGAENLQDIPLFSAKQRESMINALYIQGSIVRVIPQDEAEFDSIITTIDKGGNTIVLIDEVSEWASNKTLHRLCRVWRHRKVSLFITTQMVGRDISQSIFACNPRLYLFRLTNPRSIEWVEKWHEINPETIRNLPLADASGSHYISLRF